MWLIDWFVFKSYFGEIFKSYNYYLVVVYLIIYMRNVKRKRKVIGF